jgi:uncharacterized protein (TIGR02147 family)
MTTHYYNHCLQQELERRIEKNPRYSLRAFASSLGVNPGALSQILSGTRYPSYKMAVKILQALALSPEDQNEFFKSIARVQKARGLKRQNPVFRKSDTALPAVESPVRELSLELFKVIADWYHYAILELTFLPEFKPTAAWIAGKLGISEIEAKLALSV